MSILSTLSGKELYWSILSGGKKLIEHQEEINKINVFPVPDADTGSNMAATVTSVIYHAKENGTIKEVAESIGDAALDGARGNSGVIFAQFLYGIGQEMNDMAHITTKHFAQIVKKASQYVYDAVPTPQEGTILTVIREWADYIHEKCTHIDDFTDLFNKAEIIAKQALERTAQQIEAIKLAKVVDAGAKGFVLFLEGMKETLSRRAFSREDHDMEHLLLIDTDLPIAEAEQLTEESLHHRFCTETCIIGENIDKNAVLEILNQDSDSIVTAGSSSKLRLHFHTNNPAEMFAKLRQFGNFSFQKIEDMRQQYNVTHHRKHSIALVIDSGVALDAEFIERNQIHVVPCTIELPEGVYHDNRSLDLYQYTKRVQETGEKGRSSQPSPKAFADIYNYLSNYYDSIIVLSMSQGVSGTYNSAVQGIKLAKLKKQIPIDIIDSRHLSASAGVIAYSVSEDINKGLSHTEVLKNAQNYIQNTQAYINFRSIDHLIESGRLGSIAGNFIKGIGLCPIIGIKDGNPHVTGAAFSFNKALQKSLKNIKTHVKNRKVKGFVISHAVIDNFNLNEYVEKISKILDCEPWSVNIASPVMAPNVGFGAIAVGITYDD